MLSLNKCTPIYQISSFREGLQAVLSGAAIHQKTHQIKKISSENGSIFMS